MLLRVMDDLPNYGHLAYALGLKLAADQEVAYDLSGLVYLAGTGHLLMAVPAPLIQGVFAAMDEPGIELPPAGPDGQLSTHVTVN
jgi:hypothetical protein